MCPGAAGAGFIDGPLQMVSGCAREALWRGSWTRACNVQMACDFHIRIFWHGHCRDCPGDDPDSGHMAYGVEMLRAGPGREDRMDVHQMKFITLFFR